MAEMEKVIKGLEAIREFFGFGLPSQSPVFEAYQNILTNAITMLKEQEAVVRCKDCKHGEVLNNCIMCNSGAHNPDWFCADGEKRE